jgi:hypothetical protein
MNTYRITYQAHDNRVYTTVVRDVDEVCAQMAVILKTGCRQIVAVVKI